MEAPDGPVLVLAGAGSGKTRVIIERMAWLVEERGVDPRYLLALTFTNKAAAEMRGRLAARLGVERLSTFLGTFHSFGLYVLRREMDRLGRSKNFTIFDETDQLSLMKRLVKDLPSGNEPVSPRAALSWISRLKQNVDEPDWEKKAAYPAMESMRLLWKRYHEALKSASAVDVDEFEVAEGLELPGADLSNEELAVRVLPKQQDEFTCMSCFLVHHRSQLAREKNGQPICRDCD